MNKRAIIIYGPPGSGKGTQAELLVKKYGFAGFDTGHYIEMAVHDPGAQKNSFIRRERKLFDSGKLNTPSWVIGIIKNAATKIADSGNTIVLSGSPRTMFEAFGDDKQEGLMPLLAKKYGKNNVNVVRLRVADKTSLKRNSSRLICSICGLPVLGNAKVKKCAFCAGNLKKRTLDNPIVIKTRLKEYRERTYPIIEKMKQQKFKVIEVNGEPLPYKVFESVKKALKLR